MGGVAEPGNVLAGVDLPEGLTAEMLTALMHGRNLDPNDPAAVSTILNELIGGDPGGGEEAKPGSMVLMPRPGGTPTREIDLDEFHGLPGKLEAAGGGGATGLAGAGLPGADQPSGQEGPQGLAGFSPETEAMSRDAARNRVIQMTDAEKEALAGSMIAAGLLDEVWSVDDLIGAWDKLVDKSTRYFDAGVDMTPFDLIAMYRTESERGVGNATTPETVVRRDVTLSDSTSAHNLLRAMLRSELGRNPSPAEVDDFQAALNTAQTAAPEITTSSSVKDAAGNTTVNSQRTGGMDAREFAQGYVEDEHEAEYRQYQGASTYYNALIEAAGRVV